MKIETSGVVFIGTCSVQSNKCTAIVPAAVTAVWEVPSRNQIDVCSSCLSEKIRKGDWEVAVAEYRVESSLR